ncbi:MAG: hypothetical protein QF886_20305, partial [Planctomycetota bacterium]|nr:hypothetical protein [Planctomycetota bacterium]
MQSDAQIEPPLDFVLTLERVVRFHGPRVRFDHFRTGILYEDVDIHLRRRGGRWLKPSVHGFSGRLSKRFVLHKINTDQLKWKQNSLSGKISMTSSRYLHRSDMTIGMVLHHTPPELKPVIGWHLGGQKRIRPQKQTFHITTDPNESGVLLRLSIRDALQGKQAGERKLGMELKLRRTGDTWTHLHAVTPKWNRAFHDVDASALKVTDERIAGTIAVILRPDRWVPAGLQSKRQHYTFAGRVTHGDFVADCQSEGDFGSYETSVTGRLLQTIQSQCTSKGIDAKRHGRSLVGFVSAEDALESLPPREEAGEIYADIRALHQALVEYPAGQTSQTRPKSPTVVNDQALKNLVRVSRAAMGGLEKEPTISMGVPPISDENFGPFEGDSSPLAGAPNVEEERSWEFLDKWQCSGPMPLV